MKQLKKLALIFIAFVGFAFVTQAVVYPVIPKPQIVSATTNNEGVVQLVVNFTNTQYVDLEEYIDDDWKILGTFSVEYSGEIRSVRITITGLTPGLHTFRAIAKISEDDPDAAISEPFTVYVNEPQN